MKEKSNGITQFIKGNTITPDTSNNEKTSNIEEMKS